MFKKIKKKRQEQEEKAELMQFLNDLDTPDHEIETTFTEPDPPPAPVQTEPAKPEPEQTEPDKTIEDEIEETKESLEQIEQELDDNEIDLDMIAENPEQFIEINMIQFNRVVETFYIFANDNRFDYEDITYEVDQEEVYLLPQKGFFIPTSFYYEGIKKPIGFKQTNKGITGRAMTLLYRHTLYEPLLKVEEGNINIFIVILTLALLVLYGVGMYFLFFHQAGGAVLGA